MVHKFDPFKHHRRSVRYKDWDYRTPGFYFVTICTHQRECLFDDDQLRQSAENRLIALLDHFPHVRLDEWIVMPNHIHVIVWIVEWPPVVKSNSKLLSGSIGAIVGSYKSQSSNQINNIRRSWGNPVWQRGYWDRIIRNETELNNIRKYICENPDRWAQDRDNLDTLFNTRMTYHP